jgi:hypothetical protein
MRSHAHRSPALQPGAHAPPVGFAGMPASADFDQFVPAGLSALGIEADEVELAVMRATHETWWPAIAALLELDLSGVEPEPGAEMSRAPRR